MTDRPQAEDLSLPSWQMAHLVRCFLGSEQASGSSRYGGLSVIFEKLVEARVGDGAHLQKALMQKTLGIPVGTEGNYSRPRWGCFAGFSDWAESRVNQKGLA